MKFTADNPLNLITLVAANYLYFNDMVFIYDSLLPVTDNDDRVNITL